MRFLAFLFSGLVGLAIGHVLLKGAAAVYTSSIISYHLYLGILIKMNKKKTGVVMKRAEAALTHMAFLAVTLGLPYLRAQVPLIRPILLFMPALAPFEVEWLFSRTEKKIVVRKEAQKIPTEQLLNEATAQDEAEFLAYMKRANRPFRKPGRGVREEYAFWLADRASRRRVSAPIQIGQEPSTESAEA